MKAQQSLLNKPFGTRFIAEPLAHHEYTKFKEVLDAIHHQQNPSNETMDPDFPDEVLKELLSIIFEE